MLTKALVITGLVSLAGCVAAEEPAPARYVPPPSAGNTANDSRYQAAPLPNATMRGPNDSVIKIQR